MMDYTNICRVKPQRHVEPKTDKRWWRLAEALLHKKEKGGNIPPLKDGDKWCHEPVDKANAFSKCWKAKSDLPQIVPRSPRLNLILM